LPYDVKLPDIGEGVAEGEIVRWLVKPGEAVREDQPLVEVMTDKASVEIPSPRTGTIEALHVEEGKVVPVGTVLVSIAVAGEPPPAGTRASAAGAAPSAAARAASSSATATAPPAPRVQATPAVRQLARELGVGLEDITGSGPAGAITADDVRRSAGASSTAGAKASSAPSPGVGAGPSATAGRTATGPDTERETRIPLRGLRRVIAEHMRRSVATAAHFTFVAECDMTAIVEQRDRLKGRAEAAGIKLTYLAFVLKALIEPLRRHPQLNASLDDERGEIVLKRYYHIGVATHTDEGLTAPVVRDLDRLTLFGIAREVQRLADAARRGALKLEELQGGTFTVTTTGAKGGVLATPILHHPQVGILGVHEVKKRPAVVDGEIVARDLCNLSLSLDHRVVDGAVGAEFLYDVVHHLEHPAEWLGPSDIE
jgi:pyruvate dehydrogenase E2 component (dihydrolipoamide acetyltransferase)